MPEGLHSKKEIKKPKIENINTPKDLHRTIDKGHHQWVSENIPSLIEKNIITPEHMNSVIEKIKEAPLREGVISGRELVRHLPVLLDKELVTLEDVDDLGHHFLSVMKDLEGEPKPVFKNLDLLTKESSSLTPEQIKQATSVFKNINKLHGPLTPEQIKAILKNK